MYDKGPWNLSCASPDRKKKNVEEVNGSLYQKQELLWPC